MASKPSTTISLGGEERLVSLGFRELQEFEQLMGGKSVTVCFKDGFAVDALIKILSVGIRVNGKRLRESEIIKWFDAEPAQAREATEKVTDLLLLYLRKPDSIEADGKAMEGGELADPTAATTGTG